MAFFTGYNRKYWEDRVGVDEDYDLPDSVLVQYVKVDWCGSGKMTVVREERVVLKPEKLGMLR